MHRPALFATSLTLVSAIAAIGSLLAEDSKAPSTAMEAASPSLGQSEVVTKDSIAIVCLAGGRGERLTTPQAICSENHVCPKPLCTLPSGESFLETLAANARSISSKVFVSTNIPEKKQISQAQYEVTKEIREKTRMKSKAIRIEYRENKGLGSAYAAYGEEIRNAIKQDPTIKYVFIVPGDAPYVTDPSFLRAVLDHHRQQEIEWGATGKKPGLTIVSTDYIDDTTGKCVPTITFNMGCMARDFQGQFVGMVEAPFLKQNPNPVRFPIGKNSKHEDVYIYPDTASGEDDVTFIERIRNSSEVCAGVLLYSKETYDSLEVDDFFEKKGERDAFSGPIAQLIERDVGISAFNIHKKWILDGVNTRTQLRALNKTVSANLKQELLQRGVIVDDMEYISISDGFLIDDIEPGATLRGDIFLSGRIQISKEATLSNVTLQGYENPDRIMKIGVATIGKQLYQRKHD